MRKRATAFSMTTKSGGSGGRVRLTAGPLGRSPNCCSSDRAAAQRGRRTIMGLELDLDAGTVDHSAAPIFSDREHMVALSSLALERTAAAAPSLRSGLRQRFTPAPAVRLLRSEASD